MTYFFNLNSQTGNLCQKYMAKLEKTIISAFESPRTNVNVS